MPDTRSTSYSFTKLVVHDLEKMAAFYQQVYGLRQIARIQAEIAGEPIDEIILGVGSEMSHSSIILLRYTQRQPPQSGEVILGWSTTDLAALLDRIRAAGGRIVQDLEPRPELNIKLAFASDPEGHLAELVQMLG
jgi:predicted enzyme related to lactoylglutathione lyase